MHTEAECQIADTRRLLAEDEADFQTQWPEPPDGARIEWEARDGSRWAAIRQDGVDDGCSEPGECWYYYNGHSGPLLWRDLVDELNEDGVASMTDVIILVEAER